jgi:hypothetical protein
MWAFCAAARDRVVRLVRDGTLSGRAETVVAVAVLTAWHAAKICRAFMANDAGGREIRVVFRESMGV